MGPKARKLTLWLVQFLVEGPLRYKNKKIEVKASAYLQSWYQKELSKITFDIDKKRSWDAKTNIISDEPIRSADCYVFCLYPETDPDKLNIIDVSAWKFYVLSRLDIEREFGEQKSVGITRLKSVCEAVSYEELKTNIDFIL